ncbi:4-hydroxybenzoyl-CoA reductase subunit alpha [Desulfosporosinus nitroreducens]|uniref:4-hydroxybenzoyl-CoA reductase subunit alpha n=1 Tax=Desulfosporosinus nitroreducens TaxID=2018668 RepID=UPI00207C8B6C|nr:4-hydroxybenzoyl-CoA reductase subunit alpha [Desulfosporosinus nitroreducens]MCO1603400.1 4-hydroxybenzoyl-CoA reductase subunit alpha [Desulfosporosinus nitroreducens]
MSKDYAVIGKNVPKIDGREKATGAAKYAGDLKFPNMLFGKILTSPHAHAKILSIDTSEAEKLPGVKAVITHKDVPALKYGISPARWDENIFCIDKVRFVGDKVAAVACIDEETCYKALKLIKVEYEVLPAVLDALHAMDEGAPQVHDEYPRNINTEIHQNFGDLDKAMAEAHYIRKDYFVGQRTYQSPIEPHSAVSIWKDNKLTIYSSTQSPHYFQYYIAREFGLKMGDVRIIKPFVGGGFGGKLEPTGLEFAGSVLAKLTGRPVRTFYDRHEMFAHNRGRHKVYMELTTGVDKEGKILGVHANFVSDGGAYTSLGVATSYYAGGLLTLTYEFENYKFDMIRVYTNLPACGAQRGHGAPQPKYAFESHLDNIAKDLGIDPLEIRLRNARQPNTVTINDFGINSCELTACLEKAADISGWREKKGNLPKGRGIGIATGSFVSGAGYPIYRNDLPQSAAMIKVHEDGTAATLYTGAVDIGQGSDTALCQMAAEAMGYRYENMKIIAADTETTPHDFGAYSSRQTLMSGSACKQAGEEIKKQILDIASTIMSLPPDDLDCRLGIIFSKSRPTAKTITFEEAARRFFVLRGPLLGRGVYHVPRLGGTFKGAAVATSPAYSFCAQISEVQIDEETGEVDVCEVWDVHDCGQVINPMQLHGQVHGALYMGVGEAIWEEVLFDDQGKIQNPNLGGYMLPTALDMPIVHSELVESYEPAGPWGVKEVGEGATNPTMGCFNNAIYDAMGVRIDSLPLTYEKVWRAMKEKREGKKEV